MKRFLPLLPMLFAAGAQAQTPTWNEDIACIVHSHCAPCHHDGGPGHFNLLAYVDGHWWRNEMLAATQARYMPPWPPDPAFRSLAHERVLTQAEIDLIAAWVNGDAPEGDAQNTPTPPSFTNEPVIASPDITAVMEEYAIPASTSDLYRCFVLPVDNPSDSYITGLEVIPGNTAMVHHVLVYQDTSGQARVLDDDDIEPGYTSFGGIGVPGAVLVGVWVPGSQPLFTPEGMGIKLLAGADIVIQVHYPATSSVEVDSTRVNLRLAPTGFMRELHVDPVLDHLYTITDGPLLIPPDQVSVFHAQYTTTFPATITAIGPHSHLLGKRMKAWAVKPGGIEVPLIDIPDWDFRWQGMYSFRNPIYLPTGTTLYCETTYDNTAGNPDNPHDPPQWVWLGEATTNEMMLYYFAWTIGVPGDEAIVVDDAPHTPHYADCMPGVILGESEHTSSGEVFAWPNPASERLAVDCGQGAAQLRLIDASGRELLNRQVFGGRVDLDIASLARGSYVLELISATGGIRRYKQMLE
ncbi:MAG: hypothetical protein H6591_00215 [Flavobacteriales bacterium]|nr:hypothetical protein [Flavobacteriales bacterium]